MKNDKERVFRFVIAIALYAIYYAIFENQNDDLLSAVIKMTLIIGLTLFVLTPSKK